MTQRQRRIVPYSSNAFLAIIGVLIALQLLLLLNIHIGYDSAAYYYEGLKIARGGTPYLSFVENKNPGIYYLLSFPAVLGGWNPSFAILLFRLIELSFLILVYRIISIVSFQTDISTIAITILVCWSCYLGMMLPATETIYVELPEIVLILISYNRLLRGKIFAGALSFGLAILFRQTAILYFPALLSTVLLRESVLNIKAKSIIIFLVGTIVILLPIALIAYINNWLTLWWEQAIVINWQYMAGAEPFAKRLSLAVHTLWGSVALFPCGLGLLISFLVFLSDLIRWEKGAMKVQLILFGFFAVGLIESSSAGKLFMHHFIPLIAISALILGNSLARLRMILVEKARPNYIPFFVTMMVISLVRPIKDNFTTLFFSVGNNRSLGCDTVEETEYLSRWIAKVKQPGDAILVWGHASQLYLESETDAASRYHHNLLLTNFEESFLPIDSEAVRNFQSDLRTRPPRFILLLSNIKIDPYLAELSRRYYQKLLRTEKGEIPYLELIS